MMFDQQIDHALVVAVTEPSGGLPVKQARASSTRALFEVKVGEPAWSGSPC
jgi:hypothetical protein